MHVLYNQSSVNKNKHKVTRIEANHPNKIMGHTLTKGIGNEPPTAPKIPPFFGTSFLMVTLFILASILGSSAAGRRRYDASPTAGDHIVSLRNCNTKAIVRY